MQHQQSREARISAELTRLRTDLDELRSKIEQSETNDKKMVEYLDQIDAKKEELNDKLRELKDNGSGAMDELNKGLKEAWDRLAIATKAAKARLH